MYLLGSSSSLTLMVLLVISVEQNDLLGARRVVGQSSAYTQVFCSPGYWPGSTHAGRHQPAPRLEHTGVVTETLRDLTSTALSPFLKLPYSSTRAGGTGLSSNWKTSAILSCGIHCIAKRGNTCSAHSRWPMRAEHSLCLAPRGHCRCH